MRRCIVFISAILFSSCSLFAQTEAPQTNKNIIYVELMGNSGIYSFNYERILATKGKFQFSLRAGFGAFPAPGQTIKCDLAFPFEPVFTFGRSKHRIEVSAGLTTFLEFYSQVDYYEPFPEVSIRQATDYFFTLNPGIAYRYEKPEGGFFMRAGVNAMIPIYHGDLVNTYPILPYPKVCLGYKFKNCPKQ